MTLNDNLFRLCCVTGSGGAYVSACRFPPTESVVGRKPPGKSHKTSTRIWFKGDLRSVLRADPAGDFG